MRKTHKKNTYHVQRYILFRHKNGKYCTCPIHNNHSLLTECMRLFAGIFCSVKFMDKIRYVHTLEELSQFIPMEHVQIPECVLQ